MYTTPATQLSTSQSEPRPSPVCQQTSHRTVTYRSNTVDPHSAAGPRQSHGFREVVNTCSCRSTVPLETKIAVSFCGTFFLSTKSTSISMAWELHEIVHKSLSHWVLLKEGVGSFSIKAKPWLSNTTHISTVSQKLCARREYADEPFITKENNRLWFLSLSPYMYVSTQACTTMHVWKAEDINWAISPHPSCGLRGLTTGTPSLSDKFLYHLASPELIILMTSMLILYIPLIIGDMKITSMEF